MPTIGAEEIARAEKTLRVVYGGDLGRQLQAMQVERESLDNVISHCNEVIDRNYRQSKRAMDPRLGSAFNTMMVHMFLVGVVCGGNAVRAVE